MRFQTPLVPGRLIKRYKRFLADVILDDGRQVTAHCANPGAMIGLQEPGLRVWLEPNDDPKKKLKFGWRVVQLDSGAWVGIDTSLPNKIIDEALRDHKIAPLAEYNTIQPEQKYGANSRVDFLLSAPTLPQAYVEVKNVHLLRSGDWAEFPDTVTARGLKHLGVLGDMAEAGHRAVLIYCVQHTGCARFRLATDLDPAYAEASKRALQRGVEMLCYSCAVSCEQITLERALPLHIDSPAQR
ncbi:MAG: DNA/RNA nuclease SfsA [Planktomarina sp.]|nr:DNA/RNA nuclease SfsA [Planktomarina sp.]